MQPVIRLDRITKRFGSQIALDDVSLEVPPGVVFAMLGENGAGKTTAIRILLALAEPDAGQAEVLGRSSRGEGLEIRRRVGYVPEQPTLYQWMTVAEIGWFTAGFYGDGFLSRYRRMAVMAVLGQLVVMVFVREGADKLAQLFGLALAGPALYALGCGATLFATEHETETFQFQRSLPTTARCLFIAKLAFALMSTSVLFALLWTWTVVMTRGRLPDADTHLQLWGLFGGAAVELLIWGMFFSLLTTRPLQAAMLSMAAASTFLHLIVSRITTSEIFDFELKPYLTALPYRAVFALVILLVDIRLAHRWFQEASATSKHFWSIGWRRKTKAKTCDILRGKMPTRAAVLGRLIWQQLRQTGWLLVTVGIVPVMLGFPFARIYLGNSSINMLLPLAVIQAALIGSCVFFADQEGRRFRFLAEHGVRPQSIWLSRQLVGLGLPVRSGLPRTCIGARQT